KEHVADFPEIEIRILAKPKTAPVVAQVVFPPSMSIQQAKAFIYRELEEVAVQCAGQGAWLSEQADAYHVNFMPCARADAVSLELEEGLVEWVVPATAQTCRLE